MNNVFGQYADLYQAMYADKSYKDEAHYIQKILSGCGIHTPASLIEFGAGSGDLAVELQRLGFSVLGVDLSAEMVAHARPGTDLIVGDFRSFDAGRKFDGAVAFFHVMSYMNTARDVDLSLKNVARHLRPGGIFVCDFWFSSAVEKMGPEIRVRRARTRSLEILRISEPSWRREEKRVDVKFTIFTKRRGAECFEQFEEIHEMRYFSEADLRTASESHGMVMLGIEETISRKPPNSETWGVTAYFEKSRTA